MSELTVVVISGIVGIGGTSLGLIVGMTIGSTWRR